MQKLLLGDSLVGYDAKNVHTGRKIGPQFQPNCARLVQHQVTLHQQASIGRDQFGAGRSRGPFSVMFTASWKGLGYTSSRSLMSASSAIPTGLASPLAAFTQ